MQDKILKCRDCGQEFVFTSGEQDFYAEKGFSEPTRCSTCRAARKSSRGEGSSAGSRDREMFPAVCAQCGKPTQVPFQPREDRPVYCSDCFSAQRGSGGGRGGYSGGGGGRGGYGGGGGRANNGRSGGGRGRGKSRYDDGW